MHATTSLEARRAAILELLRQGPIPSQGQLGARLQERGLGVNQATLSRDLTAIGAVKGPVGYTLPPASASPADDPGARLSQAARQFVRAVTSAQNQVVLRTPPGGAAPLAAAIDAAAHPSILGTLAGDDTILVITPDARAARKVAAWLEEVSS
jgi:transcriptional regulator of arginine metabolism